VHISSDPQEKHGDTLWTVNQKRLLVLFYGCGGNGGWWFVEEAETQEWRLLAAGGGKESHSQPFIFNGLLRQSLKELCPSRNKNSY
jgi:hypothetical protein